MLRTQRWRVIGYAGIIFACALAVHAEETMEMVPPAAQIPPPALEVESTPDADAGTLPSVIEIAVYPAAVPSKAEIRALLEAARLDEAEAGYTRWAECWREDDPALLRDIMRAQLTRQYRAGETTALAAMLRANDPQAFAILNTDYTATNVPLPAAYIDALRCADGPDAVAVLRHTITHADDATVDAAIEAIGQVGDRYTVRELQQRFESSPIYRRVLIARTLARLKAARALQQRYLSVLDAGDPANKEEAIFILAATGYAPVATDLRAMLKLQEENTYPLALAGLAALPDGERIEYIRAALQTKSELLLGAGLAGLDALPPSVRALELRQLIADRQYPTVFRAHAVTCLAREAHTAESAREIIRLAENGTEAIPVQAAALQALPSIGALDDPRIRAAVRERLATSPAEITIAARAALLSYALSFDPPRTFWW